MEITYFFFLLLLSVRNQTIEFLWVTKHSLLEAKKHICSA